MVGAGARVVGKTNLDQFATGLVGTRSPYGTDPSPLAPGRVSGVSSSGSALAGALGEADIALGTETAGSGRVPAAFCGIVGLKPTPGWLPTRGVVSASRPFDWVSMFAVDVATAARAVEAAAGYDAADPWSRRRPDGRGTEPPKPGVVRVPTGGSPLEVEVWAMGADGSTVNGVLCEPHAVERAEGITTYGSWRAFLPSGR